MAYFAKKGNIIAAVTNMPIIIIWIEVTQFSVAKYMYVTIITIQMKQCLK